MVALHSNAALLNSDGATVVLQGQSMAHGNVLLNGWQLSLDSWWTLDVPFYAVATAILGVGPADLFVVPAVIGALVVVAAVALVRAGRRGAASAAGAALVLAVLVFPSHMLAFMLLAGPVHQSTVLYSLVAFACLRRNRLGVGFALAIVVLAAGLLGDLQMLAYGVLPLVAAGLAAMLRTRNARAGAIPLAAALASGALAFAVRGVVDLVGGFEIGPGNTFASAHQMLDNFGRLPAALGGLLGVVPGPYGSGGVPPALLAVHVVPAALLGAALALAAVRLVRAAARREKGAGSAATGARSAEPEPWRVDDLLLFAALGSIGTFVTLSRNANPHFARYLTAAVVAAAVLAGRELTRRLQARTGEEAPTATAADADADVDANRGRRRRAALGFGAAVTACFAAGSLLQLTRPVPPETASGLVRFLEDHHLTRGIGDFWLASISTVESHGRVVVRPVVPGADGVPEAYNKGLVPGWFAGVPFRFLVVTGLGEDPAMRRGAVTAFGEPSRSYSVDGVTVLVWAHPIHVTSYQPPQ